MTVNVTLRATKGQPLTNAEMDANFFNLATAVNAALSASTGASPATTSSLGGIVVGSGLSITTGGILSVIPSAGTVYTLPPATTTTLGGVKIGTGLFVDGTGTLSSVTGTTYVLPTATSAAIGGVKVGAGLAIDSAGTLSANAYALPVATSGVLGGVKVGAGIAVDSAGVVSIAGMRVLAAVNFRANGTIRKSFNVSTVTRSAAGRWTVTFTTPMPDANYLVSGMSGTDWDSASTGGWNNYLVYGNGGPYGASYATGKTVNYVTVMNASADTNTLEDVSGASILIFG